MCAWDFGKLGLDFYLLLSFGYAQDESMHSGADVEAFQAALNRDIGGDASTSQNSDSDKGASFSFFSIFHVLSSRAINRIFRLGCAIDTNISTPVLKK